MNPYLHGTYGNFDASISEIAEKGSTVAAYVGIAPVNLIRGYKAYVNAPVALNSFDDVKRYCGYSDNWSMFSLCEAFKLHFNNPAGINIGPVVAINVLDPATHKADADTTVELSFVNGRAYIKSNVIILDTLKLTGKTEGVDYSVSYDFAQERVVLSSIGDATTGSVEATYSEVDPAAITEEEIIGEATEAGVYSGLGCVPLIYQELGLIPNMILCPGWSSTPTVYKAMVAAATQINGHWFAKVYADIPLVDGGTKVDTIAAAKKWATDNGYDTTSTATPFWPMVPGSDGNKYHLSVMWAWMQMQVDVSHNGLPMETASNKAIPITGQYFGEDSTNRGFDQQAANKLNAVGIATACFWGGQWVLWGPHTGAYKHGAVTDHRVIFDSNVRMMMHVLNRFQTDNAGVIDHPMTRAMADTIKNREQEKVDAWAAMGAFVGTPVVEFVQSDNSNADMVEGNFVWRFKGTPTPAFKSGTMNAAYTTEGINAYFAEGEV